LGSSNKIVDFRTALIAIVTVCSRDFGGQSVVSLQRFAEWANGFVRDWVVCA
jgi:hypothetical protein